jgi:RNA polymerase sigma-70 factor (ECF subfamily)
MCLESRNDDFMQLVTQHQVALYGYIFALVQHAADADDVFQRTLLTLWRRFDDFEPGTNFAAWAWKTAKFEALNHARSKRRERLVFSDSLATVLADQIDGLASDASDESRRAALDECMQLLHEKDRQLLQLCYEGDSPLKSIAEQLGRTAQSVCNSLKRIRTALFNCVEQKQSGQALG